jgi:hypothetical protein
MQESLGGDTALADGAVAAVLNYQQAAVEGPVRSRRDLEGSDGALEGAIWEGVQLSIGDGRNADLTLDEAGFELRGDSPVTGLGIDFFTHASVTKKYYALCEELVQKATGAKVVKAFDHNVRSERGHAEGRTLIGGSAVQQPAGLVHGDYTKASAPRRLAALGEAPKANDALKDVLKGRPLLGASEVASVLEGGARFALINVWRNIDAERPVASTPLACCDARTTHIGDLLTFEIHYADRVGENYFARHDERHVRRRVSLKSSARLYSWRRALHQQAWWYFPRMEHDEAMLIKQWDSAGALACGDERDASEGKPSTFSMHSAFKDPTTPKGAPTRESIEVRCVAIFEEEARGGAKRQKKTSK